MSNDMTIFQENTNLQMADAFKALATTEISDDLSGGVSGNYAIVSMRGSKWRVKFQGNEQPIVDGKGEPMPSLEVVILKANPFLTKQYFGGGYEEGNTDAPLCYSTDGKSPAANAPEKQHDNCALCPQNKFGSRVTDAGVDVKACQDNRKIAIVPLADLDNAAFGGPMLFRVPASALKGLAQFGQTMKARGYLYNAVAVRLGFDMDVSYPKPTFRAIRPLNATEAVKVIELINSPAVESVLGGEAAAAATPAKTPAADPDFEVAPPAATPAPVAQTVAAPAPAPAKPAKKAPAAKPQAPAAAPAQGATFGKPAASAAPAAPAAVKAAPARPAPAPVAAEPAAEPALPPAQMEDDIANILAELNGAAA